RQDVRVLKGTVVRTRDNVRFQTTEEKVIPRSTLDILPPFVKFGTVDIAIEAVDAGAAGNVAANTITITDGNDYAVSNPQATSGGEIKKYAVVTASDYGLAAGRAEEELRKAGLKKVDDWKKAAAKGQLIYGPVTKVTGVTTSAGLVGVPLLVRYRAQGVGDRRIGLAGGDDAFGLARPLRTLARRNLDAGLATLRELIAKEEVGGLVIGLPLTLRGEDGPQAQRVRRFADACAALGLPVEPYDERCPTAEAV